MVTQTSEFSHEKLQTCDGKILYIWSSACDGVQIQNVMIEDFRALKDAVGDLNR